MTTLNPNAPIIFMKGEETAGVVGDLLRKQMLTPLGIAYESRDISVASRVLTEGKVVQTVSEEIGRSDKATLVKEPGVTPSPTQLLDAVSVLERAGKLAFKDAGLNQKLQALREQHQPTQSDEGMAKFAYAVVGTKKPVTYFGIDFDNGSGLIDGSGSPNAIWRKLLGATLLRSVSAELEKNSTAHLPDWSTSVPIRVLARHRDEENTAFARVGAGDYRVVFAPASGGEAKPIGSMNIEGEDTPIRMCGDSEQAFKHWFQDQLSYIDAKAEIVHALKQTVITTDYAYIEWMDAVLAEQGKSGQIAAIAQDASDASKLSTKFLADNAVGALASKPPVANTYMISPNASYAEYVEMMQGIYDAGGFKNPSNSEVIRAAATKDHYARVEYRAEKAGTFKLLDKAGKVVLERAMQEDDIAIVTNLDRARVAILVTQTLDHAVKSGKPNVLFGFDPADPYYGIAHEELEKQRGAAQYASLRITEGSAKDLTVQYFSQGSQDTLLALGNIQGDFATDVELLGKGTSYSKALLADGRMAIETGSLGTAPDILHDPAKPFGWKRDGVLVYNPMAFVEAYAYALEGVANNLGGDALVQKTAKALEAAIYQTTRKGYMLPISSGTLKLDAGASEIFVSTHTFVQHIMLETLNALAGQHPEATSQNIQKAEQAFKQQLAIDRAVFAILAAKDARTAKWKEINWAINDALIASGAIDPASPDYSIQLPSGVNYDALDADKLFDLRIAQYAQTVSRAKTA